MSGMNRRRPEDVRAIPANLPPEGMNTVATSEHRLRAVATLAAATWGHASSRPLQSHPRRSHSCHGCCNLAVPPWSATGIASLAGLRRPCSWPARPSGAARLGRTRAPPRPRAGCWAAAGYAPSRQAGRRPCHRAAGATSRAAAGITPGQPQAARHYHRGRARVPRPGARGRPRPGRPRPRRGGRAPPASCARKVEPPAMATPSLPCLFSWSRMDKEEREGGEEIRISVFTHLIYMGHG